MGGWLINLQNLISYQTPSNNNSGQFEQKYLSSNVNLLPGSSVLNMCGECMCTLQYNVFMCL